MDTIFIHFISVTLSVLRGIISSSVVRLFVDQSQILRRDMMHSCSTTKTMGRRPRLPLGTPPYVALSTGSAAEAATVAAVQCAQESPGRVSYILDMHPPILRNPYCIVARERNAQIWTRLGSHSHPFLYMLLLPKPLQLVFLSRIVVVFVFLVVGKLYTSNFSSRCVPRLHAAISLCRSSSYSSEHAYGWYIVESIPVWEEMRVVHNRNCTCTI